MLQKTQGHRSKDIAAPFGCCEQVVNSWVTRDRAEGLSGRKTKKGRGRKSILKDAGLAAVRLAVKENRQRLSLARAEREGPLGREFSTLTRKRFLKKTVAATRGSGVP